MEKIRSIFKNKVLVLDGAMGTMIQAKKLSESDFRGERFKNHKSDLSGNNDLLTLTQPHIISKIYLSYLNAGCDIVETNTFNSTGSSQSDYGLSEITYELNLEAAKLARSLVTRSITTTHKGLGL